MAARSRWLAYAFCCVFLVAGCSDDDDDDNDNGTGAAPTATQIAPQTINQGASTGALNFTVADSDTSVNSLTVTGSSSNTTLVPNANIVFGGSGANRTVTVTPAPGQSGTATITYNVSDGSHTTTRSFLLTVNAGGGGKTFDTPQEAAAMAAVMANVLGKVGGAADSSGKSARIAPKVVVQCADGGSQDVTIQDSSTTKIVFTDCKQHDDSGNESTFDGQLLVKCISDVTQGCLDADLTLGLANDPLTTAIQNTTDGIDVSGQFFNFVVTVRDNGDQQTKDETIDGHLIITDNSTNSCGSADLTIETVHALTVVTDTGQITAGEVNLVAADGSEANVIFNADGSQTVTVNGVSDSFTPDELAAVCE